MIKTEAVITKILSCKKMFMPEPKPGWNNGEVRRRSYELWAVNDILCELSDKYDRDPEQVIWEYEVRMEYYNAIAKCRDKSASIFEIVVDTVEAIRDYVFGEDERSAP